jgi:hypothetical protein
MLGAGRRCQPSSQTVTSLGMRLINAVVSMGRRNTQLEPTLTLKTKAKIAR